MLGNLTFVVHFLHILYHAKLRKRATKNVFLSKFEQLSLQNATFEQLYGKLRATFWEISSNLWKALFIDETPMDCSLTRQSFDFLLQGFYASNLSIDYFVEDKKLFN